MLISAKNFLAKIPDRLSAEIDTFAKRENLAFHNEEKRYVARVVPTARISGKTARQTRQDKRVAVRTTMTHRRIGCRNRRDASSCSR